MSKTQGILCTKTYWCFDAHYDPWGHREVSYPYLYSIERGFTGHEQLDHLGSLMSMGGRMYDPQLGRFLSPDNFVQAPDDPQNYNRYSYCLNNPLKYTDPDGEFWHLIAGAIIGGTCNWILNECKDGWEGFGYWSIGAFAGALGAGVGAGISSSMAGGSFGAGFIGSKTAMVSASSIISGTAIGGGSNTASCFITGFGNSLIKDESFKDALWNGLKSGFIGGTIGALRGGISGGITAYRDDRNIWNGKIAESSNDFDNEIWGEISIKAYGEGSSSLSIDGHAWIELTGYNGETTSYGTWGNIGDPEFQINYEHDLGHSAQAIQSQTITNAQKARFDKFINTPRNKNWTLFKNCSYFASKAYNYTTGLNIMAHPYNIPICTPSWLVRSINH